MGNTGLVKSANSTAKAEVQLHDDTSDVLGDSECDGMESIVHSMGRCMNPGAVSPAGISQLIRSMMATVRNNDVRLKKLQALVDEKYSIENIPDKTLADIKNSLREEIRQEIIDEPKLKSKKKDENVENNSQDMLKNS